MFRIRIVSIGLFVALSGLAGCAKSQNVSAEMIDGLKPLEGKWNVVEFNQAGRKSEPDELQASWANIKGDTLRMVEVRGRGDSRPTYMDDFVIQIDPSKPPGEMNFVYRDGPQAGQMRPGIYTLEGDRLKLCLAEVGAQRPTAFVGKDDPPQLLVVLQRRQ